MMVVSKLADIRPSHQTALGLGSLRKEVQVYIFNLIIIKSFKPIQKNASLRNGIQGKNSTAVRNTSWLKLIDLLIFLVLCYVHFELDASNWRHKLISFINISLCFGYCQFQAYPGSVLPSPVSSHAVRIQDKQVDGYYNSRLREMQVIVLSIIK